MLASCPLASDFKSLYNFFFLSSWHLQHCLLAQYFFFFQFFNSMNIVIEWVRGTHIDFENWGLNIAHMWASLVYPYNMLSNSTIVTQNVCLWAYLSISFSLNSVCLSLSIAVYKRHFKRIICLWAWNNNKKRKMSDEKDKKRGLMK